MKSLPYVFRRILGSYGAIGALLLLCLYFSVATIREETPTGRDGARTVVSQITDKGSRPTRLAIVSQTNAAESEFAAALATELGSRGIKPVATIKGDPQTVRDEIERIVRVSGYLDAIAMTQACRDWAVWDALRVRVPEFARTQFFAPRPVRRSAFLSGTNLRNVADQIAVIAIIAIGMTLVIITRGIDLSVGSLVALSAVLTASMIHRGGGAAASIGTMALASLCAIAACGVVGLFSGLTITRFHVPPFIATLAMMQVASGLAFIIAQGQTIYDLPAGFTGLGRGASIGSIPNSVLVMVAAYTIAHLMMTRSAAGRRIYAVGGNSEAARLSGVPTARTLLTVYIVSGLAAGLGGVITASQLKAGAPTYGTMYELYVIAAVVVGGTSLAGGEGHVIGTLIGAFMIAVIRNGMNLMNVEPYTQKVVLGLVILAAVMLDMLRRRRTSGMGATHDA